MRRRLQASMRRRSQAFLTRRLDEQADLREVLLRDVASPSPMAAAYSGRIGVAVTVVVRLRGGALHATKTETAFGRTGSPVVAEVVCETVAGLVYALGGDAQARRVGDRLREVL